jgi:HK97 family phage portal protein
VSYLNRIQKRNAPAPLQQSGFSLPANLTGETVTEETALQVSTVMACVGLIADSVASLPLHVLKHVGDRTVQMPVPSYFSDPAPTITRYELIHQMTTSLALYGNSYVYVDKEGSTPVALTPLHPSNVSVYSTDMYGRHYLVAGGEVPTDRMLHTRWWTPPQAVKGLSPVAEQKTTIGLALAMERHLAQFYGEGGTPSSVLETDADLTVDQAKTLQSTWLATHNRHRRPAVLTNGLKWRPVTTSATDMELNASRELQIAQVARIFRVPTYMISAKGDSQTYQNAEMSGQHFVTYTLMPWLRRIEDALSSLLSPDVFVRFDVDAFLRADTLTRLKAYQLAVMTGIRTPNECRATEGLEPYVGGDEFVMALPGAPMAANSEVMPPLGVDAEPPK